MVKNHIVVVYPSEHTRFYIREVGECIEQVPSYKDATKYSYDDAQILVESSDFKSACAGGKYLVLRILKNNRPEVVDESKLVAVPKINVAVPANTVEGTVAEVDGKLKIYTDGEWKDSRSLREAMESCKNTATKLIEELREFGERVSYILPSGGTPKLHTQSYLDMLVEIDTTVPFNMDLSLLAAQVYTIVDVAESVSTFTAVVYNDGSACCSACCPESFGRTRPVLEEASDIVTNIMYEVQIQLRTACLPFCNSDLPQAVDVSAMTMPQISSNTEYLVSRMELAMQSVSAMLKHINNAICL